METVLILCIELARRIKAVSSVAMCSLGVLELDLLVVESETELYWLLEFMQLLEVGWLGSECCLGNANSSVATSCTLG